MIDYRPLDRLLHKLVLGSINTSRLIFDLEKLLFLADAAQDRNPVVVTGLARAGTTILLRALYATEEFSSLTYADMPFVIGPNLWKKVRSWSSRHLAASERAHQDGILIDENSPEAFEEVFWRICLDESYIDPNALHVHQLSKEVLEEYAALRRLVCRAQGKTRYLTKNNNSILRLDDLASALPDALFIVPVRRPPAQCASLMRQHERFKESDVFTSDYMRWLGHHEFGRGLKRFAIGANAPSPTNPGELDYWRDTWQTVYSHLLKVADTHENIVLLTYEDLCNCPRTWDALVARAKLSTPQRPEFRRTQDMNLGGPWSKAEQLFEGLRSISRRELGLNFHS